MILAHNFIKHSYRSFIFENNLIPPDQKQ